MHCTEREHLVARYETATRVYSAAVQALSGKRTKEFEVAYRNTEHLRQGCEEARIKMERHSIEHGCGSTTVSLP